MKRSPKITAPAANPVLKLVHVTPTSKPSVAPGEINQDTVEAAKVILQLALKGEINGVAFVLIYSDGQRFQPEAAGEAYDHPTFTRGALRFLDDYLKDLVRARKGPSE